MKVSKSLSTFATALIAGSHVVNAIELDLDSPDSIKSAASTIAYDMMSSYYTGNQTGGIPGNLPVPYYWWVAGAMFGSLIDYWYYTGDSSYNDVITEAMLWQTGPENDYMTPNQTKTEGNDDQGFWGLAAMSAAEVNFPNPPPDRPQWLALAQAVFNTQAPRWDDSTCAGGLRWQIFTFNNGYNYKNSISNGCFFNLGARLAKYTGNDTYAQWADKTWDWMEHVGLMDKNYYVYDGSDDTLNCTRLNHIQWTYNAGAFLLGAANMYNYTNGSDIWRGRVEGLLNATHVFFEDNVMMEVACENNGKCNIDQQSFKAYLARWLAATTKMAPFTHDSVMQLLRPSAKGAAAACVGGDNGRTCGLNWRTGQFDGFYGVGEQMSALEVIQSNLIAQVAGPVTNTTGGTSKGDPAAGSGKSPTDYQALQPVTTADRVGAGILTTVILLILLGSTWWMIVD